MFHAVLHRDTRWGMSERSILVATSTKVSTGRKEACRKDCCVFHRKTKRQHKVLQKPLKHSSKLRPHFTQYHKDP